MSDIITLTGIVATTPRHIMTAEGLPITSFRLASSQRRYDRGQQRWVDADTNWYTVTTFRQVAVHAVGSLHKGERIVVTGKQHIREWQSGERTGTTVDIDADALGHDLAWGTTVFTRSVSTPVEKEEPEVSGDEVVQGSDGGDADSDGAADSDDAVDSGDADSADAGSNDDDATLLPAADHTLAPF